jgi:NTP pyrophosphatase (non-canonical NTP hydrolase)
LIISERSECEQDSVSRRNGDEDRCNGFEKRCEPFQIITRLLEECGELAQEVSHFEGSPTKLQKHGEPSQEKFAKEVLDVLRLVFQVVEYYDLEPALRQKIRETHQQCQTEGLL